MKSHRFEPGIIVASLAIAIIALLFMGCGCKQSAESGSSASSVSTPEVSVPSQPEASSPSEPAPPVPEPPPLPPAPEPEATPVGPVSGNAAEEGFELIITADPGEQIAGGGIALALEVKNSSGQERTFGLPDPQEYDFVAYDTNGKEVWRWSSGIAFVQIPAAVSFEPGQSRSYTETWSTPGLSPGDYTIEGTFMGLPGVTPRVTISIKP